MNGSELKQIRRGMRMERPEFARLIGYTGTDRNNALRVRRMEHSNEPVPLYIARLLWLIEMFTRRWGHLPDFPEWPGYDYEHNPDPGHEKQD